MLEDICKALIQAAMHVSNDSITIHSDGLTLTNTLVSALSKLEWKSQPTSLIKCASESVVRLLLLFPSKISTILPSIVSFLKILFGAFAQGSSSSGLIAVGSSFPKDLPGPIYELLLEQGVHSELRNLIMQYGEMEESEVANTLEVLVRFVSAGPTCAAEYIDDSSHFLLLFAAQQFSASEPVQEALWKLLGLLQEYCPNFSIELNAQVLIPAVMVAFTQVLENSSNPTPLINFLIDYSSNTSINPPFVLCCFELYPELLQLLLQQIHPSRELKTVTDRKEVTAVSELMVLFLDKFQNNPTVKHILKYRIMHILGQAAVTWPELCCVSFCTAMKQFLGHLPPNVSTLPPALRRLLESIPQEFEDCKKLFFKENQLIPFAKLLSSLETFESADCRLGIYESIKALLKSAPSEVSGEWLTDEFLATFVSMLPKDVSTHQSGMQVFVFTAHYIVYTVKLEQMEVLRDQKWHEVAINDCLKAAKSPQSRVTSLGLVTSLVQGYNQHFKDISLFSSSALPHIIVDLAEKYGQGVKSEAGESFGSLVLTLTADKSASITLHEQGYLEKLYSLVDDRYDPAIVRPAIHAIGNIALSGHSVKQDVLEKDFHVTLINYLEKKMNTADSNVLSACCRVLHILASGDWAKRNFAERGLVGILLKMLETRRDTAEICWRPLGLLSSLGFMSLSNREYIITEKVLKTVLNLLKTTEHSKVKSYTALVFLASIDSDRRSADLQSLKVTEIFQQVLQQTNSKDSSYDDLKRWGSSLLEKGQLFTIPLDNSKLKEEEQQLLASCMVQSITWPERANISSVPNDSVDGQDVTLLPLDQSSLTPKFPEAPELTDNAISQIVQLGLDPQRLFRVGRFFGNSHGLCSNCEKDGRSEELIFRPQSLKPHQYQKLINRGWYRRGGVKMFRYRYNHDLDCSDWETRVLLSEFDHRKHKSYKKVLRRMPENRLTVETVPTQFIAEAYDLYNDYHLVKHDKPKKSEYSYCEHVVNSPFCNQSVDGFQYGSFHQLYKLDGRLVAVGVIDVVPNGVVSIYMWYDMSKEVSKLSFGVYSALKEIEFAKELSKCNSNIKYYYLQGWNGNNHKLSYKSRYEPEDFYSPCTVLDWVSGLDAVNKEQENFKKKWLSMQEQKNEVDGASSKELNSTSEANTVGPDTPKKPPVPGDAPSFDRIRFMIQTGQNKPDTMNVVVCLNHQLYMYLGQMMDVYRVSSYQRELMEERFEELVLAVGPELASNMVVDIIACPTTGTIDDYSLS